jgi:hypothetical protein
LKQIFALTLESGKIMNGDLSAEGFGVGALLKLFELKSTKNQSKHLFYHLYKFI